MRSSSVAIATASTRFACRVRSQTCWIMGLPAIGVRGLPGKRVEP